MVLFRTFHHDFVDPLSPVCLLILNCLVSHFSPFRFFLFFWLYSCFREANPSSYFFPNVFPLPFLRITCCFPFYYIFFSVSLFTPLISVRHIIHFDVIFFLSIQLFCSLPCSLIFNSLSSRSLLYLFHRSYFFVSFIPNISSLAFYTVSHPPRLCFFPLYSFYPLLPFSS